jgi:hypothetical protein
MSEENACSTVEERRFSAASFQEIKAGFRPGEPSLLPSRTKHLTALRQSLSTV